MHFIRDRDNRRMENIHVQKFLNFAPLIYTATFKPEFQLAECKFFNLFFAHTDAREYHQKRDWPFFVHHVALNVYRKGC